MSNLLRPLIIAHLILGLLATVSMVGAADANQFRGPDRDGIFKESGLLRAWPEGGPPLLWTAEGLGEGYASMTVVDGRIYTSGMADGNGFVIALDLSGKQVWKKDYGKEHSGNGYPGTRTTPTYDAGTLYLFSANGRAVALDAASGELRWEKDLVKTYQGKAPHFGIAESPLVVGDKVIFTPGGKDASLVALDKKTGETLWTSKGLSEPSGYCSPRLLDNGEHRQIVTFVAKHLVGVDPDSGEVLWRSPSKVDYDIHAVSPLFVSGNNIYISHGYGQGGHLYELAADGRSVKQVWSDDKLDVHHGGAVLLDGHIYGAADKKTWYCLDAASGEVEASIQRLGKGAIVYADGLLYGYLENGKVVLVDPNPENFKLISSFPITRGEGQHWSHPVVSNGVLYVRHGDVLMAYDVRKAAS